eukprot:m.115734 g.115734  ORF g.115734 m.115734 type:complete len:651 (+) comp13579_c0_seq2:35-1987(+)
MRDVTLMLHVTIQRSSSRFLVRAVTSVVTDCFCDLGVCGNSVQRIIYEINCSWLNVIMDSDDATGADVVDDNVFCVCRGPDYGLFMIACSVCDDWFHGSCVNVSELEGQTIDEYVCDACERSTGQRTVWKSQHNGPAPEDPGDVKSDGALSHVLGIKHIQRLRMREAQFKAPKPVKVYDTWASVPANAYLHESWKTPFLVKRKTEEMGLSIDPSISYDRVLELLGDDFVIPVIDVSSQATMREKMTLRDYVNYLKTDEKEKLYNVISIEFSQTELGKLVVAPKFARDADLLSTCWPEDSEIDTPAVLYYLLMGPKHAWTDFHIDFGGTSVWYHVFKGQKIFYIIKPTPHNLKKYQDWCNSPKQSDTFFADLVSNCYKMCVNEGETVFIPSGWIHCVETGADSLVVGGNFLTSLALEMQLRVYQVEVNTMVGAHFRYPNFEAFMWYFADFVCKDAEYDDLKQLLRIEDGLSLLLIYLKRWMKPDSETPPPVGINGKGIISNLTAKLKVCKAFRQDTLAILAGTSKLASAKLPRSSSGSPAPDTASSFDDTSAWEDASVVDEASEPLESDSPFTSDSDQDPSWDPSMGEKAERERPSRRSPSKLAQASSDAFESAKKPKREPVSAERASKKASQSKAKSVKKSRFLKMIGRK